ncbi:hypothetical protein BX281_4523 [Streptomyces sp. Ag82_O1-15]|nr:hypothetical protein BX281_4523 [Streptomyces sp. Ag82_O1-15]
MSGPRNLPHTLLKAVAHSRQAGPALADVVEFDVGRAATPEARAERGRRPEAEASGHRRSLRAEAGSRYRTAVVR